MDSEPLDPTAVAQDGASDDSPVAADDESPVSADSSEGDDLDDAPSDDAAADDGVFLTKAELEDLRAWKSRGEDIERREFEAQRQAVLTERQAERTADYAEYQANKNGWIIDIDENGWTREKQNHLNDWDAWWAKKQQRFHHEDMSEMRAHLDQLAMPEFVKKLAKRHNISDKADVASLMNAAKRGRDVVESLAEFIEVQNRKAAEARARKRRVGGAAVSQAKSTLYDQVAAARQASGQDTLGGSGSPSVNLPFTEGSDDHARAIFAGLRRK